MCMASSLGRLGFVVRGSCELPTLLASKRPDDRILQPPAHPLCSPAQRARLGTVVGRLVHRGFRIPPPPLTRASSAICSDSVGRATDRMGGHSRQRTSANGRSGGVSFPRDSPWRAARARKNRAEGGIDEGLERSYGRLTVATRRSKRAWRCAASGSSRSRCGSAIASRRRECFGRHGRSRTFESLALRPGALGEALELAGVEF
jgi:hypothetical protein